jgi:hypothetical protein
MSEGFALTQAFLEGKAAGFKEATDLFTKRSRTTQLPRALPSTHPFLKGKQRPKVYDFIAENPGTHRVRVVDRLVQNFPTHRTGTKVRCSVLDAISRLERDGYIVADNKDRLSIKEEA